MFNIEGQSIIRKPLENEHIVEISAPALILIKSHSHKWQFTHIH